MRGLNLPPGVAPDAINLMVIYCQHLKKNMWMIRNSLKAVETATEGVNLHSSALVLQLYYKTITVLDSLSSLYSYVQYTEIPTYTYCRIVLYNFVYI